MVARPITALDAPAPFTGSTGSTFIHWFGYEDPVTGNAVEGESWTFDHGMGDPLEGWTSDDVLENDVTAWRRITAATWSGHENQIPAPIIDGTASFWLGLFEDEARASAWAAGLGYGNSWCQRLETPTLPFTWQPAVDVVLSFDFFCDVETSFDYVYVILVVNGAERETLATYTGGIGSPGSPDTESLNANVYQYTGIHGEISFVFELVSDGSYSDEDGLYPTTSGAFGIDNVEIIDYQVGLSQSYDFEIGDDGFTASVCPGAGTYMAVNEVPGDTLSDADCLVDGNVLTFYDGSFGHPEGQYERAASPPVPVASLGDGPFNIFVDLRAYADLPVNSGVVWRAEWSYYPYVVPVFGDSVWSQPVGNYFHFTSSPDCIAFREFGAEPPFPRLVPADAESVRAHITVWNPCPNPLGGNCSVPPNFSPIFDNIRVGVTGSRILHVGDSSYGTIQAALDSAANGDTVLVRAGVYAGVGNRGLDFKGKAVLLCSEDGPENTIIDCGGADRGFNFHTGETASSVVDGFTVIDGTGQGGGIRCDGSSPTIRNCRFLDSGVPSQDGGGVYVYSCSPSFEACVTGGCQGAYGGGVSIIGGTASFVDCLIVGNLANNTAGGVYIGYGNPTFIGCTITRNKTVNGSAAGIQADGNQVLERCIVHGNCGAGDYDVYANTGGTISFVCSDVDQTRTLGNVQYDADTIPDDPAFCAPADCDSVPTASGDYSLGSHSPCLSQFSPCGELIGALGVGCFGWYPLITEVADVPNDQGRQVRLSWMRSLFDGPQDPVITGYTMWRRIDALAAPAPVSELWPESVRYRIESHPGEWDYVGTVPARGDDEYHAVVPTLCDSTDEGMCTSTFFVSAVTPNPVAYFDSEPATGYSVDNLAPAVPTGLTWASAALAWDEAPEADFDYFTVYGSATDVLDGTATVIGYTVEPTLDVHDAPFLYYHVTATDFAGNEGKAATTENPVAVPAGGVIPTAFALRPNQPNPFRSSTTITFDLPAEKGVTLTVYDISGRLVRTLVSESLPAGRYVRAWDGRDAVGRSLAPGLYFYRIEAGTFLETRKAVRLP
jgi:hypothetical protein